MDIRYKPTTDHTLMARIIEECGEVLLLYGKIQRFGESSYNPYLPPEERESNIDGFIRECDDLTQAIEMWKNARGI